MTTAAQSVERHPLAVEPVPERARPGAGAVVTSSLGLVLVALSFYLERTGHQGILLGAAFWAGFLVLLIPIAARIVAESTRRADRIVLVVLLGVLVYAIKVLHDPLRFMISDEFLHLLSAQHIVSSHALFGPLSLQGSRVAGSYPGLESLTAGLSQVSGLSLFVAGLIVIGLSRALMMLAVYLFAERISQSARVAGIAALLFAANANFLFYSAQFSYESLAFPLFMVAVVLLLERSRTSGHPRPLTISLLVLIGALTATHHLTSYALAAVLWVFSFMSLREAWRSSRAFGLAAIASAAAAAWFLLIATGTRTYLDAIAHRTVSGIRDLASGSSRAPFQTSGTPGLSSPIAERLVAYLALVMIALGIVTMLVRQRRFPALRSAGGTAAMLASLGFLALYPLRASGGAWETANRGQEILFAGAAVVLALGIAAVTEGAGHRRRALATAAVTALVCGGVISGWPFPLRLSQPLQVMAADGHVLDPQGFDAAAFTRSHLPRPVTFAADVASGRILADGGARMTYLGSDGSIDQLLHSSVLDPWMLRFLAGHRIDYVVLDRRRISADNLAGYFFLPADQPDRGQGYYSNAARSKYAKANASQIFSSGDVVIADVSGLHTLPPPCQAVGLNSAREGLTCRQGKLAVTFAGAGHRATLSGMRLRILSTNIQRTQYIERTHHIQRAHHTLIITFELQLQNFASRWTEANPAGGDITLRVGSRVLGPERRVPGRSDVLRRQIVLSPHGSLEGSATFRVRGARLIAQARRSGVVLEVRAPGPGAPSLLQLLRNGPGAAGIEPEQAAAFATAPVGRGPR